MKRIYISGPISGIDRAVYLANFAERERTLRAQGFDVLNPTRLPPARWLWIYKVLGYRLTLLYDLWHLLRCDGITMLSGCTATRYVEVPGPTHTEIHHRTDTVHQTDTLIDHKETISRIDDALESLYHITEW